VHTLLRNLGVLAALLWAAAGEAAAPEGFIVLGDRIVAWLDIQNDVFFSTDETMTKALAELLGVT